MNITQSGERGCLDTKGRKEGREEPYLLDDLFDFHKRDINLLGKLPDSFVGGSS